MELHTRLLVCSNRHHPKDDGCIVLMFAVAETAIFVGSISGDSSECLEVTFERIFDRNAMTRRDTEQSKIIL